MIRHEVAKSVSLLAEKLAAKGLELKPISGTLMDEIANSYSITFSPNQIDNDSQVASVWNITAMADEVTDNGHQKAMAKAIDCLAKDGEAVIKKARAEVLPLIESLHEKALDIVKTRKADGVRQYAVMPYRPADIFFSEWVGDILEQTASAHNAWAFNREFTVTRLFPQRTIEELMILCRTEHPGVNALIDDALGRYGDDALQGAYDVFFNAVPGTHREVLSPMDLRSDERYEGERLFGVLLALGMMKDTPSVKMPLDSVINYMQDVYRFCGSSLARYMANYERFSEKRYLNVRREAPVRGSNTVHIVVNDVAYHYWKEQGLTDEAIKGAVMSDGVRDAQKVLDGKEKYEAEWQRQERIISRTIDSNTATAIHKALMDVVIEQAQKQSITGAVELRQFEEGVRKILETCRPVKDSDLYTVVREAVLCLFHTDKSVRCFVYALDEIMTDSPSLDPRQAASLAFVDMSIAWMLSQFTIKSVKQ